MVEFCRISFSLENDIELIQERGRRFSVFTNTVAPSVQSGINCSSFWPFYLTSMDLTPETTVLIGCQNYIPRNTYCIRSRKIELHLHVMIYSDRLEPLFLQTSWPGRLNSRESFQKPISSFLADLLLRELAQLQ